MWAELAPNRLFQTCSEVYYMQRTLSVFVCFCAFLNQVFEMIYNWENVLSVCPIALCFAGCWCSCQCFGLQIFCVSSQAAILHIIYSSAFIQAFVYITQIPFWSYPLVISYKLSQFLSSIICTYLACVTSWPSTSFPSLPSPQVLCPLYLELPRLDPFAWYKYSFHWPCFPWRWHGENDSVIELDRPMHCKPLLCLYPQINHNNNEDKKKQQQLIKTCIYA